MKNIFRLLLVFLTLEPIAFSATREEQCSYKNFEGRFGPVRHQGVGWCFAFVASDLIGEKMKIVPPNQISAFDVGSNYYSADLTETIDNMIKSTPNAPGFENKSPIELRNEFIMMSRVQIDGGMHLWQLGGGVVEFAIDVYKQRGGACLERDLPSSETDQKLFVDQGIVTPDRMGDAIALHQIKSDNGRPDIPMGVSVIQKRAQLVEEKSGLVKFFSSVNMFAPPADPNPLLSAMTCQKSFPLSYLEHSTPLFSALALKEVDATISQSCGKRIPLPDMTIKHSSRNYKANTGPILQDLNQALTADRPVGASYDIGLLTGDSPSPDPGMHVSVVEGRQWNKTTQECEYRIRNSFGENGCEMLSNPALLKGCTGGQFWVGEKDLSQYLRELTYIP